MSDIIALFREGTRCSIGFCVGGAWSKVYTKKGELRTWESSWAARAFLRAVARTYCGIYGESLGWDVDAVPVIECR